MAAGGKATLERLFYKALILLAAAGVKLREGKLRPASRHYGRAAAHLRAVQERGGYETGLSLTVAELLEKIGQIARSRPRAPMSLRLYSRSWCFLPDDLTRIKDAFLPPL